MQARRVGLARTCPARRYRRAPRAKERSHYPRTGQLLLVLVQVGGRVDSGRRGGGGPLLVSPDGRGDPRAHREQACGALSQPDRSRAIRAIDSRRGDRSSRPVDQRAERRRAAARAGLFRRGLLQLPDDDAGFAERRSRIHARSVAAAGVADDAAARRLVERGQAAAVAQARARAAGDEDRKRHDRGFRSAQESLHHAFAARHPSDAQADAAARSGRRRTNERRGLSGGRSIAARRVERTRRPSGQSLVAGGHDRRAGDLARVAFGVAPRNRRAARSARLATVRSEAQFSGQQSAGPGAGSLVRGSGRRRAWADRRRTVALLALRLARRTSN